MSYHEKYNSYSKCKLKTNQILYMVHQLGIQEFEKLSNGENVVYFTLCDTRAYNLGSGK